VVQNAAQVGAMGAWGQSNSFPETINAAVRSGLDAREILGNLTTVMETVMPMNVLGAEGQESAGATQAINDMLCSSYAGYIALFERWPLAEDASFTNLRAKGGFLVSGNLQTGTATNVTIVSAAGQPVILFSPWSPAAIVVTDIATDKTVAVQKGAVVGTYSWASVAGAAYRVAKAAR